VPGQDLEIVLGGSIGRFDSRSIGRIADHLAQLLRGMLGTPAPRLGELLSLLDGDERHHPNPGSEIR
jgi:hypothetical protein